MTATELIQKLTDLIESHGDFTISVEDGMDPSDEVIAERVEVRERGRAIGGYKTQDATRRFYIS